MSMNEKADRIIKLKATMREHKRVYDHMILPARDIIAECSDGIWVREVWNNFHKFGWTQWKKQT